MAGGVGGGNRKVSPYPDIVSFLQFDKNILLCLFFHINPVSCRVGDNRKTSQVNEIAPDRL